MDRLMGLNDSGAEIGVMTRWIADNLGLDVPLHFTAFHPDYRMLDRPPTPPATLMRARAMALGNGCITSTRATCTMSTAARPSARAATQR